MSSTNKNFSITIKGTLEKDTGKKLQTELDGLKNIELKIPFDKKFISSEFGTIVADMRNQLETAFQGASFNIGKGIADGFKSGVGSVGATTGNASTVSPQSVPSAVLTDVATAAAEAARKQAKKDAAKQARVTQRLNDETFANYESMQKSVQVDDRTRSRLARLEKNFGKKYGTLDKDFVERYGSDEVAFLSGLSDEKISTQERVNRKHFLEQRKELEGLRAKVASSNAPTVTHRQMPEFTAEDYAAMDSVANARSLMDRFYHTTTQQKPQHVGNRKKDANDFDIFQPNTRAHPSLYYFNGVPLQSSEEEIVRYASSQGGSLNNIIDIATPRQSILVDQANLGENQVMLRNGLQSDGFTVEDVSGSESYMIVTQDEQRHESLAKAADIVRFAQDYERRHNVVDGVGYTIEDIAQLEASDSEEDNARAKHVREVLGFHDKTYEDYGGFKTLRYDMSPSFGRYGNIKLDERGLVNIDLPEDQKAIGTRPQVELLLEARQNAMVSQGVDMGSRLESTVRAIDSSVALGKAEDKLAIAEKKVSKYIEGFAGWSEEDKKKFLLGYDSKQIKGVENTRELTTAVNNIKALKYGVFSDKKQQELDEANRIIGELKYKRRLSAEEKESLDSALALVTQNKTIAQLREDNERAVAKAHEASEAFVAADDNLSAFLASDMEVRNGEIRQKLPAWKQKDPLADEEKEKSKEPVDPDDQNIQGNDRHNRINEQIKKKRKQLAEMKARHAAELDEITAKHAAEIDAMEADKNLKKPIEGGKLSAKLTPKQKKEYIEKEKLERQKYFEAAEYTRRQQEEALQSEIDELVAARVEAKDGRSQSEKDREKTISDLTRRRGEYESKVKGLEDDIRTAKDEGDKARVSELQKKLSSAKSHIEGIDRVVQRMQKQTAQDEKAKESSVGVSPTKISGKFSSEGLDAVVNADAQTQKLRDLLGEASRISFGSKQEFNDYASYVRNSILSDFVSIGKDGKIEVGGKLDEMLIAAGSDTNAQNVIKNMQSEATMLIHQLENSWDRIGADIDRREEEARKRPVAEPDRHSYNGRRMEPEEYYGDPERELPNVEDFRRGTEEYNRALEENRRATQVNKEIINGLIDLEKGKEVVSRNFGIGIEDLDSDKHAVAIRDAAIQEALKTDDGRLELALRQRGFLSGERRDIEDAEQERQRPIREIIQRLSGGYLKGSGEEGSLFSELESLTKGYSSSKDMSENIETAKKFSDKISLAKKELASLKGYIKNEDFNRLENRLNSLDDNGRVNLFGRIRDYLDDPFGNDLLTKARELSSKESDFISSEDMAKKAAGAREFYENIEKAKDALSAMKGYLDDDTYAQYESNLNALVENQSVVEATSAINDARAKASQEILNIDKQIKAAKDDGASDDVIEALKAKREEVLRFLDGINGQMSIGEYDNSHIHTTIANVETGRTLQEEYEHRKELDAKFDEGRERYLADEAERAAHMASGGSYYPIDGGYRYGAPRQRLVDGEYDREYYREHDDDSDWSGSRPEDRSDYDERFDGASHSFDDSNVDISAIFSDEDGSAAILDADTSSLLAEQRDEAERRRAAARRATGSSGLVRTREDIIEAEIAERDAIGKQLASKSLSPVESIAAQARFRELGERIGDGYVDFYNEAQRQQARITDPNRRFKQETIIPNTGGVAGATMAIAQAKVDGHYPKIDTSVFNEEDKTAKARRREAIKSRKEATKAAEDFIANNPLIAASEAASAADVHLAIAKKNPDLAEFIDTAGQLGRARRALNEARESLLTEEDEAAIKEGYTTKAARKKARKELAKKRADELDAERRGIQDSLREEALKEFTSKEAEEYSRAAVVAQDMLGKYGANSEQYRSASIAEQNAYHELNDKRNEFNATYGLDSYRFSNDRTREIDGLLSSVDTAKKEVSRIGKAFGKAKDTLDAGEWEKSAGKRKQQRQQLVEENEELKAAKSTFDSAKLSLDKELSKVAKKKKVSEENLGAYYDNLKKRFDEARKTGKEVPKYLKPAYDAYVELDKAQSGLFVAGAKANQEADRKMEDPRVTAAKKAKEEAGARVIAETEKLGAEEASRVRRQYTGLRDVERERRREADEASVQSVISGKQLKLVREWNQEASAWWEEQDKQEEERRNARIAALEAEQSTQPTLEQQPSSTPPKESTSPTEQEKELGKAAGDTSKALTDMNEAIGANTNTINTNTEAQGKQGDEGSGGDDGDGTPTPPPTTDTPAPPAPPAPPKTTKTPKEPEIDETKIAKLKDLQNQINQKKLEMIAPDVTSENYARLQSELNGLIANYHKARGEIELTSDEIKEIDNAFKASQEPLDQTSESVKRLTDALRLMDETSAHVDNLRMAGVGESLISEAEKNAEQAKKTYEDMFKSMSETDEYGKIIGRGQLSGSDLTRLVGARGKTFSAIDTKQLKQESKEANAIFNELRKTMNSIDSLNLKKMKLNPFDEADKFEIDAIDKELEDLYSTLESLSSMMSGKWNNNMRIQFDKDRADSAKNVELAEHEIQSAKVRTVASIRTDYGVGKFDAEYKAVIANALSLKGVNADLDMSYESLAKSYTDFTRVMENSDSSFDDIIESQQRVRAELDKTKNLYKVAQNEIKASNAFMTAEKQGQAEEKFKKDKDIFSLNIDNWLRKNSAAEATEFGARLRDLQFQLRACNNAADFNRIKSEFKEVTIQAELAGKATMNFGDRLKMQAQRYAAYFSIAELAMEAWQGLRYMYQAVLDVDSAMVGLYRVTDLTSQQYDELYDNMIASAKAYGQTLTDTINATTDWIKAGFDEATSLGLAEATSVYQHISDLDYDTATENLLTAYKGFEKQLTSDLNLDFGKTFGDDTAGAVNYITDVLNELDNKFAVTSAGIGEALQRSASSMQVAGNTMEQTAALVSAAMEVTQDPEGAGSTMKILSMRLRGMKGELADLGEEVDENVENISKMQGQVLNLTHGKVNIFGANGDFRSTYDIMKDIADVWEELSTIEQADLIETIAGKHRANTVSALIGNFGHAEEMLATALEATGSAAKENEKYLDSLQGRTDVMTASLQALSNTVLNSDFLKGGISAITGLVDVIEKLIGSIGLIPNLAGIAAGALSFKGMFLSWDKEAGKVKIFKQSLEELRAIFTSLRSGGVGEIFANQFNKSMVDFNSRMEKEKAALLNLQNAIANSNVQLSDADRMAYMVGMEDSAKEYAKVMTNVSNIETEYIEIERSKQITSKATDHTLRNRLQLLSEYNKMVDKGGDASARFAADVSVSDDALGKYMNKCNGAKGSTIGLTSSLVGAAAKTVILQVAMSALSGLIMMGISFAISAAIGWISKMITAEEDLAEEVKNVTDSYKQQHGELSKNKSNFEQLAKSYDKLAKGVNRLTGANESLTPKEFEEYQDVVNQIADTMPNLVKGYDDQGNAILDTASNVNTLTEAYKDLIIAENEAFLRGDGEDYEGASEIAKDLYNDYDNLSDTGAFNDQLSMRGSKQLEEVLKSQEITPEIVGNIIKNNEAVGKALQRELQNKNLEIEGMEMPGLVASDDTWNKFIAEACKQHDDVVQALVDNMNNEMDYATKEMRTVMDAHMENQFLKGTYSDMDNEMQGIASDIVEGLDSAFIMQLNGDAEAAGKDGEKAVTDYVDGILGTINGLRKEKQDVLKEAFNLSSAFASGDINYGEYKKQLENSIKSIEEMGFEPEVETQLILSLNADEVTDTYDALYERLTSDELEFNMNANEAKSFLNSLSSTELQIGMKVIPNMDAGSTAEDIKSAINREILIQGLNLDFKINDETEWAETLSTALEESSSAAGMTAESIEALTTRYRELDEFDAAKLFEKTAQGVRANTKEVNKLESALQKKNKTELNTHMEDLQTEYKNLTKQIEETDDVVRKSNLYAQRDQIVDQINDTATLISQYDGLCNAYNNWLKASEAPDKGDMHDQAMELAADAEELEKSGRVGTDEYRAYAQFLSSDDLTNADASTLVDVVKNQRTLYNRHFTTDESGAKSFVQDLSDANEEWAKFDDETGKWKLNVDIDDAAEHFGVSVSYIMAMLDELESRGFGVSYLDKGLEEYKTQGEEIQELYNSVVGEDNKVEFKFGTGDLDTVNTQLEEAKVLKSAIEEGVVDVPVDSDALEQLNALILNMIKEKQALEVPAIMSVEVDYETAQTDLGKAIYLVQQLQEDLWLLEQSEYDPTINVEKLNQGIQNIAMQLADLASENPELWVQLGLDDAKSKELQTAVAGIEASVKAGVKPDEKDLATVQSTIKNLDATVVANVLGIDSNKPEEVPVTPVVETYDLGSDFYGEGEIAVSAKKDLGGGFYGQGTITLDLSPTALKVIVDDAKQAEIDGTANVSGTAFAKGTVGKAFKRGDWGIKGSGVALGGELGQELVVRDGRYFTIGDDGAEFFNYKSGDIIFNAGQTRQLFEQGKITNGKTRGRAIASGSAFASGSISSSGRAFANINEELVVVPDPHAVGGGVIFAGNNTELAESLSKKSSSSSSGSSSGGDAADEFKEKIDWIEVAIDRIERAIDKLDLKANSIFKKWSTRNKNLVAEISKVREEIELQEAGAARYLQEAESVGLSAEYMKKVQDGTIDIETITNEDLKEKIDEYQQWYEKFLDCKDAAEELKETEAELHAQRFEHVKTEYDGILSLIEAEKNLLEEFINQAETRAWLVSAEYYKALVHTEEDNLAQLKSEEAALLKTYNEIMDSGTIDETSEQWVTLCNDINEVTLAIEESNTQLLEYKQTLQQLDWEVFDLLQDRISNITNEADFLVDLLSSDKLHEDNGRLTDEGMATMGLHGVGYNVAMAQADKYAEEIKKIEKELESDPFDTDLQDRYYELIDAQRDAISSAQDYKESIRDLVEEGIDKELESLQELIDKHNEALDSQKDLYDYQKKLKEQTEEIASLEKQMAAYRGDDSEETRAKVQELKVSYEEAKEELEETEYDRFISDSEKLLDELYEEYEEILNERLDNLDLLVSEMIAQINENAVSIKDTISAEANAVGYDLSESMKTIWNAQSFTDTSDSINKVITDYGEKFLSSMTTTNSAIRDISSNIASMIGQLNKIAGTKVKSAQQTAAEKAAEERRKQEEEKKKQEESNKPTAPNKPSSGGDGKPKVGDKVKFMSGQYYYDSYGKSPLGSQYQGREVYITNINENGSHPYHISTGSKLGSGDLGWLKLNQLSGYASGKKSFLSDELAWTQEDGTEFIVRPSDGAILTPLSKGDSVLNASATNNLWRMANSPADFIKESLGIGNIDANIGSGGATTVEQNFENVSFIMPNVKNYEEMLMQMKKDKNFQRLVDSMGVDQMAGKSHMRKGKSIR